MGPLRFSQTLFRIRGPHLRRGRRRRRGRSRGRGGSGLLYLLAMMCIYVIAASLVVSAALVVLPVLGVAYLVPASRPWALRAWAYLGRTVPGVTGRS